MNLLPVTVTYAQKKDFAFLDGDLLKKTNYQHLQFRYDFPIGEITI